MTMTFDELHAEMRRRMKWRHRLLPKRVTRRALRGLIDEYDPADEVGTGPLARLLIEDAIHKAFFEFGLHRTSSIWLVLLIEAIKILATLLVEWWNENRDLHSKTLDTLQRLQREAATR